MRLLWIVMVAGLVGAQGACIRERRRHDRRHNW